MMVSAVAVPMKNMGRQPSAGSTGMANSAATTPPSGIPAMVMVTTREACFDAELLRAMVMAVVSDPPIPNPVTNLANASIGVLTAEPVRIPPRANSPMAKSRTFLRPMRSASHGAATDPRIAPT